MRLFGTNEAAYYCASYKPEAGDAEGSLPDFRRNRLVHKSVLREGQVLFSQYRACSLRDVERRLFLAASHYRRILDLMLPSASPWAHVTAYYGSWHSAHALLGMFGGTVFSRWAVDVEKRSPGAQELMVRKIGSGAGRHSTTYTGAHRIFWDLFYRAVAPLIPRLRPVQTVGLSPVGGDPVWLIDRRNEINYDTWAGVRLSSDFQARFSKDKFPGCLPGVLQTQYSVFEALLELAFSLGRQFGLGTDALDSLTPGGGVRHKVRDLVYGERVPGLVSMTRKRALV